MRACIYCKVREGSKPGITFHNLPRSAIRAEWLKNMKVPANWTPKDRHYLCSNHFDSSCFKREKRRVVLKEGSLPTIFKGRFAGADYKQVLKKENTRSEGGDKVQLGQQNLNGKTADHENSKVTKKIRQVPKRDIWRTVEIEQLLEFYIHNKDSFLSDTNVLHLWKDIIPRKSPECCDKKLLEMKNIYNAKRIKYLRKKQKSNWKYYKLCHRAFHDDKNLLKRKVSGVNYLRKAKKLLILYLGHKKALETKDQKQRIWSYLAKEMDEDEHLCRKRFLHYKKLYIRRMYKRNECGPEVVKWPLMELFDQIFSDDIGFQRKHGVTIEPHAISATESTTIQESEKQPNDWDDTESTDLVQYYWDYFDQFQDVSILDILWTRVGKLLNKPVDICKQKYGELKLEHIKNFLSEDYKLQRRKPIDIFMDNIISKETKLELLHGNLTTEQVVMWNIKEVDMLVQLVYGNIELFTHPVCHFVCWCALSNMLGYNMAICRAVWSDLLAEYQSMESQDVKLSWRYEKCFDEIFYYCQENNLMISYDVTPENEEGIIDDEMNPDDIIADDHAEAAGRNETSANPKEDVNSNEGDGMLDEQKLDIKKETTDKKDDGETEEIKITGGEDDGDTILKILQHYQKNKDKFSTRLIRKQNLWKGLAKELGISVKQCVDIFDSTKQKYEVYVEKLTNSLEKPIPWAYYDLCQSVFGDSSVREKVKTSNVHSNVTWPPNEINRLIDYFSKNFNAINTNIDKLSVWTPLARDLDKTENECKNEYIVLRDNYRKNLVQLDENPKYKVKWPHFKQLDAIYSGSRPDEGNTNVVKKKTDCTKKKIKSEATVDVKMESVDETNLNKVVTPALHAVECKLKRGAEFSPSAEKNKCILHVEESWDVTDVTLKCFSRCTSRVVSSIASNVKDHQLDKYAGVIRDLPRSITKRHKYHRSCYTAFKSLKKPAKEAPETTCIALDSFDNEGKLCMYSERQNDLSI